MPGAVGKAVGGNAFVGVAIGSSLVEGSGCPLGDGSVDPVGVGSDEPIAVGVGVGVGVPGVGLGLGVGLGTPPWQLTLIVNVFWAILALTVRWPSAGPNWSVVLALPWELVTDVGGETESWPLSEVLKAQLTDWPSWGLPLSEKRMVAVICTDAVQLTSPDGLALSVTMYGYGP